MDSRRLFGSRAGRIILLGDGTEVSIGQAHDDDGDVDMEDRGVAEEVENGDLEEQVQSDAHASSTDGSEEGRKRGETPAPQSTASSTTTQNSDGQQSDSASKASGKTTEAS